MKSKAPHMMSAKSEEIRAGTDKACLFRSLKYWWNKEIFENIDIDIDKEILENIDIDIDKDILENIDIDK